MGSTKVTMAPAEAPRRDAGNRKPVADGTQKRIFRQYAQA
jgi:hypothetical protein